MGGVAKDFSSFIKTLMSDSELVDLMLVADADKGNFFKMIDKYFCETVTSGIITTTAICRIIIMSNPQSSTNNIYVKSDMLAIEIFVPNAVGTSSNKDRILTTLERRSNLIADRILALLNNKIINGRKLRLEGRHELASGTPGFCRMYLQFSYLRAYN